MARDQAKEDLEPMRNHRDVKKRSTALGVAKTGKANGEPNQAKSQQGFDQNLKMYEPESEKRNQNMNTTANSLPELASPKTKVLTVSKNAIVKISLKGRPARTREETTSSSFELSVS